MPFEEAAGPMDPNALALVFFAHALKWPGAVKACVAALPVNGGTLSGAAIVHGMRAVVQWADGRTLANVHQGMSKGLLGNGATKDDTAAYGTPNKNPKPNPVHCL